MTLEQGDIDSLIDSLDDPIKSAAEDAKAAAAESSPAKGRSADAVPEVSADKSVGKGVPPPPREDPSSRLESLRAARQNLEQAAQKLEGSEEPELRGEVSVATIGRMLGLVTSAELKLLEGKLDLMSTRVAAVGTKLDKLTSAVGNLARGSDVERIEVLLGTIRSMLKEALANPGMAGPSTAAQEQSKKLRDSIQSNRPTSSTKVISRIQPKPSSDS